MIEGVAVECGDQPDLWPKRLVHQLVLGGLDDRAAARRMTGDWIIFAKHEGRNFYLAWEPMTRRPRPRCSLSKAASGNRVGIPVSLCVRSSNHLYAVVLV